MRFLRHLGVVCLLLCATLIPTHAHAALIHKFVDTSSASTAFNGEFAYDNDLALLYFTLSTPSMISAEVTSGFDSVLTLFVDFPTGADTDPEFDGTYWFAFDRTSSTLEATPLGAGNYVLALTQYDKYFSPISGFDYDGDTDAARFFTRLTSDCETGFGAFESAECGTGVFSGTLTVEPVVQPAPEPGTLSLLALGGAAAAWRRRTARRSYPNPPGS